MHHSGPIAGVAAFENFVATAGYDNQVILWNAETREALARANHDHLVNHCAFSPDGKWLVSASSDYSARVWSIPDLRLRAALVDHEDDVDMAEFSHDSRYIATCALDRCVRIFNLDGRCLQVMRGHSGNVLSLTWMADNRRIMSSSVDGTLRTWDSVTGECLQVVDLQSRTDSFALGSDGTIFAGDDQGRISVTIGGVTEFIPAHRAGIKKIIRDSRQDILVTLGYDRCLKIWKREASNRLVEYCQTSLPECIWARGAAVLSDGRIVTGTFGSTYAVFDGSTLSWDLQGVCAGPSLNAVLAHHAHIYTVGDAGIVSKDGAPAGSMGSPCNFLVAFEDRVLTGGHTGVLYDAGTGEALYAHHSPLNCAAEFERNGELGLAIGTYTGEILCFKKNIHGELRLDCELSVFENAVKSLAFCDGMLFSVCANTDLAWHRVEDWTQIKTITKGHERIANGGCALGGERFASIGRDRMLRIWSADGQESYLTPHKHSVKCIAVDSAQMNLITGSYGGTLALFNLKERVWTKVLRPTSAGISSVTWNENDRCFLAASYDGSIYPIAA